ncbi:MAG: hypothetical protein H7Y20_01205 [Bryobacteraceae bacterium]|nr:hypothetical protein [Bryobacteraceae bacterium]
MHRKWLCISAALTCLVSQAAFARNIFVTSGDSANPTVSTINVQPFSFGANTGAISGGFAVLPTSNPQKFYLISRSATDTVLVLEGRFPNVAVTKRLQTSGGASAARVTPDGRRIVVVGPNGVAVIDTVSDLVVVQMGVIDAGSTPVSVATSVDSTRAYVVSASTGRVTAINLTNNTIATSAQLNINPSAVSVAPTGVVYVSGQNGIVELDPVTLSTRANIAIAGAAADLQFTTDGRFAVARNSATFSSRGAFLIDLLNRRTADIQNLGFTFSNIALVDNRTAYGISPQGTLYVLSLGTDGTFTAAVAQISGANPGAIREIATSGELPRAQSLILSVGQFLYRLDTTTTEISEPVFVNFPGNLSVVSPLSSVGAAGVLSYNTTQTVASGTTSLPLVVQAYDASGLPVSGTSVQFTSATPGVTIAAPSGQTDASGFAVTTVAIPASITTGAITVNASIANGQRSATFTINVGDPALPGGGPVTPPGGTPLLTGLQIVLGQGQVVSENFSTAFNAEALQVRLYDSAGRPVANSPITWTLVQGNGSVNALSVATDIDGFASANFTASSLPGGVSFATNTIRASAGGQEATFYVTALRRLRDAPGSINVQVVAPQDRIINARTGDIVRNAIQFRIVTTLDSTPVPFVGLRVFSSSGDSSFAGVQCQGGTALSDATGLLSCDLVVGARQGSINLAALVGSVTRFDFTLNITLGLPATARILGGTPQSGNPGSASTPLTVQFSDAGGNITPGAPVTWDIPALVTIQSIQRETDLNGQAAATLIFPATAGSFTVSARSGTAVATFTLNTNAVAGSINKTGGDQQIAIVGQAFSQQIGVRVLNSQGQNLSGATVSFAVTSGSATVSTPSATTGTDGIASTAVTAGSSAGPVVITATSGGTQVTFGLTVRLAGPAFTPASFLNGAGFQPGISPGSIAYIRVAGVGTGIRGSVTAPTIVGPLPTRLADVEVLFNNIAAPIYSVSNINGEESVVVQVPFEVTAGAATVTIRTAGGGSTTVENVQISAVKPGVFTYADASGVTYGVATRPDGSYVSASNPARRGENVRIFATGLGQTSPATGTNRVGLDNQPVAAALIVGVNNSGTRLVSAQSLAGTVGVYVITLEIPANTQTGPNQPIGLAVTRPDGQLEFANGAFLPIQ